MEKRKRRSFSSAYKAEVVDLVRASGKSIGAVAKDLGLTETAVRAWVRQAAVDGVAVAVGRVDDRRARRVDAAPTAREDARDGA